MSVASGEKASSTSALPSFATHQNNNQLVDAQSVDTTEAAVLQATMPALQSLDQANIFG